MSDLRMLEENAITPLFYEVDSLAIYHTDALFGTRWTSTPIGWRFRWRRNKNGHGESSARREIIAGPLHLCDGHSIPNENFSCFRFVRKFFCGTGSVIISFDEGEYIASMSAATGNCFLPFCLGYLRLTKNTGASYVIGTVGASAVQTTWPSVEKGIGENPFIFGLDGHVGALIDELRVISCEQSAEQPNGAAKDSGFYDMGPGSLLTADPDFSGAALPLGPALPASLFRISASGDGLGLGGVEKLLQHDLFGEG